MVEVVGTRAVTLVLVGTLAMGHAVMKHEEKESEMLFQHEEKAVEIVAEAGLAAEEVPVCENQSVLELPESLQDDTTQSAAGNRPNPILTVDLHDHHRIIDPQRTWWIAQIGRWAWLRKVAKRKLARLVQSLMGLMGCEP